MHIALHALSSLVVVQCVTVLNINCISVPSVEFALQSQHETISDYGLQLINDVKDYENKSRKRLRSLSLLSINSSD